VELVDEKGFRKEIGGSRVVVSAGAIESARLLFVSEMGNHSDQLGRHLQAHLYTGAHAEFDQPLANVAGPGVTISTCQFNHGNQGIVGGGMIANDFPVLPIQFWATHQHRAPAPWGLANKQWMRDAYQHLQTVMGPTQEIPNPESRIQLDSGIKDRHGMPVAQLSGDMHPESIRTGLFMRERAGEWLAASGGVNIEIFGAETGAYVSAGQHQAGTCRMGDDPATSVTDSRGRVYEYENLYVADASLHVTNGGFNPGLTVMALASLVADGILSE
jgi:choline dehydrogenase-like flavoprotein